MADNIPVIRSRFFFMPTLAFDYFAGLHFLACAEPVICLIAHGEDVAVIDFLSSSIPHQVMSHRRRESELPIR